MKQLIVSMLLGATLTWWFASANAGEPNEAGRHTGPERHDAARHN